DGAVGGGEPALHMERRPRSFFLVLRDAESELARLTLGRHVGVARYIAADVAQYQLQRAPYRGICAPPLAKDVAARIEPELPGHGAVYDDERRAVVGRSLYAVKPAVVVERRFEGSQHHREVLRAAACHHGVHGYFLDGCLAHARRYRTDAFVRVARHG